MDRRREMRDLERIGMVVFVQTALWASAAASVAAGSSAAGTGNPDRDGFITAVLYLTGEPDMESVGEDVIERYEELERTPLDLNNASRSRLLASGLFTQYQVASLRDYLDRTGEILSFTELASVDGFSQAFVEAVSHFVMLSSSGPPGERKRVSRADVSSDTNLSLKYADGAGTSFSMWHKLRAGDSDRVDFGLSAKKGYDTPFLRPSSYSAYMEITGRRRRTSYIAGDYALRFGQGLALWSGFRMGGFSGDRSFWKRPTGITPSRSLSAESSHRGIAAEISAGRFDISAFLSIPGLRQWCESGKPPDMSMMPGFNAGWFSRYGTVSLTSYGVFKPGHADDRLLSAAKVSVDARFCVKGSDLFAEAAFDPLNSAGAVTGGFCVPFHEKWKTALSGRWIQEGYDLAYSSPVRAFSGRKPEAGVAAGLFYKDMALTADLAFKEADVRSRQLKLLLNCPIRFAEGLVLSLRVSERLRSYEKNSRTDVRADLKCTLRDWQSVLRADILKCSGFAWLAYAEEGYVHGSGAVYLRGTLFSADSWDDRLYSYERDAPGSFNVPAYYGRGYAVSIVARQKFRLGSCFMKVYFRAGFTDCPWSARGTSADRPARAECRMQLSVDF
ncbi:MAG: hypothetical protein ACI3ZC_10220 [Candidatus Cryptobacteroides sp.]